MFHVLAYETLHNSFLKLNFLLGRGEMSLKAKQQINLCNKIIIIT